MSCIKLKKLEEILQGVDSFENPKIKLEQYETPSHIASQILFTIQNNFQDIQDKCVADLGCGPGMLSIGASVLGAQHVVGFEIDKDAIEICQQNLDDMELSNVDLVICDILTEMSPSDQENSNSKKFDTVLINPPFGTKRNAGIDMKFLQIGISLAKSVVYSLHKTSTRNYIQKKCKDFNVNGKVIAELKYNLDKSYRFHKKDSVDVEIDFWRFEIN